MGREPGRDQASSLMLWMINWTQVRCRFSGQSRLYGVFFVVLICASELEFGRRFCDGDMHGQIAVGGSCAIFS